MALEPRSVASSLEAAGETEQELEGFEPEIPSALPGGAIAYIGFGDVADCDPRGAEHAPASRIPELDQQIGPARARARPLARQGRATAGRAGDGRSPLSRRGRLGAAVDPRRAARSTTSNEAVATVDRILERGKPVLRPRSRSRRRFEIGGDRREGSRPSRRDDDPVRRRRRHALRDERPRRCPPSSQATRPDARRRRGLRGRSRASRPSRRGREPLLHQPGRGGFAYAFDSPSRPARACRRRSRENVEPLASFVLYSTRDGDRSLGLGLPRARRMTAGREFLFTSESVTEGHPGQGRRPGLGRRSRRRASPRIRSAGSPARPSSRRGSSSSRARSRRRSTSISRGSFARRSARSATTGRSTDSTPTRAASSSRSTSSRPTSHRASTGRTRFSTSRATTTRSTCEGAGDQGMMFGYACTETEELMPLPIMLAHRITKRLAEVRKAQVLPYLRPDGKAQVTVRYEVDEHGRQQPVEIERVLISTQHRDGLDADSLIKPDLIEHVLHPILPKQLYDEAALRGAGLRARQPDREVRDRRADGRHRPDRTQDHRRHVRRRRAPRRRRVLGQGSDEGRPVGGVRRAVRGQERRRRRSRRPLRAPGRIRDRGGASGLHRGRVLRHRAAADARIEELVREHFDLRPAAIIRDLDLLRPIYRKTAAYGHFGRADHDFSWERADKVEALRAAAGIAAEATA